MDSIDVEAAELHKSVALVIQGPLLRSHSFTLQSLAFYRRILPKSRIVLSTWPGMNSTEKATLEALEVEVVESPPPSYPGVGNLNFQIRSTSAGLRSLEREQVDIVIKMRTDQRLYSQNAFAIMTEFLEVYPRKDKGCRMGASSLNSFLARPFSLSDMVQFSNMETMLEFWAIREVSQDSVQSMPEALRFPEALLVATYLRNRGWSIENAAETWHRALAEEFVVVDSSSLDQFWQKYSKREYLWRRYGNNEPLRELDYGKWLTLKAGETPN